MLEHFERHIIMEDVEVASAPELRVQRTFMYLSPLGRVPTYAADIRPLYDMACARCHSTNIARDLRGYSRLADMAPIIAAVCSPKRSVGSER